jgi:hypothetical protein
VTIVEQTFPITDAPIGSLMGYILDRTAMASGPPHAYAALC